MVGEEVKGSKVKIYLEGKEVGFIGEPIDISGSPAPKKVHGGCGQPWIDHQDLRWQSDWNGCEVGYPEVSVVGLYGWRDTNVELYLNVETMEILDMWEMNDDE